MITLSRLFSLLATFVAMQTLAAATPAAEEALKKRVRAPVEVEYPSFTFMFDAEDIENKSLWDRSEFEAYDARKREAATRYVTWIKLLEPKTTVRVGRSHGPDFPDGDVFGISPRDWLIVATTTDGFRFETWKWAMDCPAYHELLKALERFQKTAGKTPNGQIVEEALEAIRRMERTRAMKPEDMADVRALLAIL